MARPNNRNWNIPNADTSDQLTWILLLDLRDELQKLNRVFECHNFVRIPRVLDQISENTKKRKPKAKRR